MLNEPEAFMSLHVRSFVHNVNVSAVTLHYTPIYEFILHNYRKILSLIKNELSTFTGIDTLSCVYTNRAKASTACGYKIIRTEHSFFITKINKNRYTNTLIRVISR